MKRLFASLYLDEDVSVHLGRAIRVRGFDVLTTLEARRLGAKDAEQLAFAMREGRAMLTHNRVDFARLHDEYLAGGKHHSGIFVAGRRRDPSATLTRLLGYLDRYTADELCDLLFYL